MTPRVRSVVNCPHCGIENLGYESRCRACSRGLTVTIGPAAELPRRLSVGSMMGLVLATTPGLALVRRSPLIGIWLMVVLVPATLRTLAGIGQASEDGRALALPDRFGLFAGSFALMLATSIVAAIIGAVVTVPLMAILSEFGLRTYPIPIATGIGLAAAALILRSHWPSDR